MQMIIGGLGLRLRVWPALCALALACIAAGISGCDSEPVCGNDCGSSAGESGADSGTAGSAGAAPGGSAGKAAPQPAPDLPIGACLPRGPAASALGSARSVLYSGPRALGPLAVRRSTLYAVDPAEGIFRLAPGENELERVVRARTQDMLVADLNLYYIEARVLFRVSLSATDATPDRVVAVQSEGARLFAYDQDTLYFADGELGLFSAPIAGGMLEPLAANARVADAKLRAGQLYYADLGAGHVYRLPSAGGERVALTSKALTGLAAVEADATFVYFAHDHIISLVALDGPGGREPFAVSGLAAAGKPGPIRRLVMQDDRLFFSDDASIGWANADGSECKLVVHGLTRLSGWAVDEDAVYLTTAGEASGTTEIWRIAL